MSKSLKDLLTNIIPKEHLWKITIFQNWDNIIGNMKNKVIIDEIKDDTLYLGVIHPAWAQELQMLSPMLKTKINSYLEKAQIKSIRFKLISAKTKVKKIQSNNSDQNSLTIDICKKLSKTEQLVLNNISDNELRDVMHNFGLRCKKMRRNKK